ncbi:DUF692 domain-containing protein [soil metagenome]
MKRITGVGLGLRWEFIDALVAELPALPFLEVSTENYMGRGGYYRAALDFLAERYPLVTHGLTMSLGGTDPLDATYLRELRAFIEQVRSPWHSDHLCFGSARGVRLHDLLPLRFSEEAVERVADRVRRAQDALGVPVAIENISFYVHPGKREMSEGEFVRRVCERADCGLLLDVNNAWVNSQNFGFDVDAWVREVPLDRVIQIHVAGPDRFAESDYVPGAPNEAQLLLDTHGSDVPDQVLALLARVLHETGPVPVLLERDRAIPPLADLIGEVARVQAVYDRALLPAASV